MRTMQMLSAMVLVMGLGVGCGMEGDPEEGWDDEVGEDTFEIGGGLGLLSQNSLKPSEIEGYFGPVRTLLDQKFVDGAAAKTLATFSPRVLEYMGRCGLPRGTKQIFHDTNDAEVTGAGLIGLIPNWISAAPSGASLRWGVACIGAHINAFGERVTLRLTAPHANFNTASAAEAAKYPVEEGTFAGFVGTFNGVNGVHFFAFAGKGVVQKCGLSWAASTAALRVCTDGRCGPNVHALGTVDQYCIRNSDGLPTSCTIGTVTINEVLTSNLESSAWINCGKPYNN